MWANKVNRVLKFQEIKMSTIYLSIILIRQLLPVIAIHINARLT